MEQVDKNDILEKAKAKAQDILNGTRLKWEENSKQKIDAFLKILPDKEHNEFETNRKAIENNAQTYQEYRTGSDLVKKEPGKLKTWFNNLFKKKEKVQVIQNKESDVSISQPEITPEKPWYETFSFDTSNPKSSMQSWCEKVVDSKLNSEQYKKALEVFPTKEFRVVATHMQHWYKTQRHRKDFSWNVLSKNGIDHKIMREFTEANDKYKRSLSKSSPDKSETKGISSDQIKRVHNTTRSNLDRLYASRNGSPMSPRRSAFCNR